MKKFTYFDNEQGSYTICYDLNGEEIITGIEKRKKDAIEVCRRLNRILSKVSLFNESETLYIFCGWLTTRKEKTIMSSSDNAAPIAELIKEFCDHYRLPEPRKGWEQKIVPIKNKKQIVLKKRKAR